MQNRAFSRPTHLQGKSPGNEVDIGIGKTEEKTTKPTVTFFLLIATNKVSKTSSNASFKIPFTESKLCLTGQKFPNRAT